MREIGKSTLLDELGILIGFGYGSNTFKSSGWWVGFNIYRISAGIVICISEGQGQYDVVRERGNLGQLVPGAHFSPFAARFIGAGLDSAELREMLEQSLRETVPDIQFEWVDLSL